MAPLTHWQRSCSEHSVAWNSPDDSRTGVNIRAISAFLQDRRTALAVTVRHDNRVHLVASLPSLIHCSLKERRVPRSSPWGQNQPCHVALAAASDGKRTM